MITPNTLLLSNDPEVLLSQITQNYIIDENDYVQALLDSMHFDEQQLDDQKKDVELLITDIRKEADGGSGIDSFLQEYSLDTEEGIILMCLAEALLRIPDAETADALIEDKLSDAAWDKHLSKSDSLFVNASTWGLMLSGKVTGLGKSSVEKPASLIGRMVDRLGEPVIRAAMYQAMKIMGKQFVLGRTIDEALKSGDDNRKNGYTHSFDMLGEAALTADDAKRYHKNYFDAITAIGNKKYEGDAPRPGISIKLSALHPRYEESQRDRVLTELYDSVIELIEHARKLDIQLTIDAEEMDRLELSLHLFQKLYKSESAKNWGNFGLVVQAYSTRALPVLHWLNLIAEVEGTKIPVRLVKGAYWDSEIKLCQQMGLESYPVFTRKVNTDVSYIACAHYLLSQAEKTIFPQFATHNAQTASTILHFVEKYKNNQFEFQRLHGMGHELYDEVLKKERAKGKPTYVRIYAPVGAHKDLLPYLVRRLLENGANTSFVHKLVDPNTPVESLAAHPVRDVKKNRSFYNTAIVKPTHIFSDRKNSKGLDLHIEGQRDSFITSVKSFNDTRYDGASLINGEKHIVEKAYEVKSPYNHDQIVGTVSLADAKTAKIALTEAQKAYPVWNNVSVQNRAAILNKIADLFEENQHELVSLCMREAGKVYQDSIDEIREAVDFCRYYAVEAENNWGKKIMLPGPTGETNELEIMGRGVFFCISPWNFPLAIFTGQIVAALVTGNTVIAKPAESTNLIAYRATQLMHEAGVSKNALQLVCGRGRIIGQALVEDDGVSGVCFTGSTETAKHMNRTLAARDGAIVPFIAETGGQNAMLVDSTSLPEQVVTDVVHSAFMSAGQRCSALRVLFLQEEIADKVIELLKGAMQELVVSNPEDFKTDIASVIDSRAQKGLLDHLENITKIGKIIYQAQPVGVNTDNSTFVPPTAVEIDSIRQLEKEQFGPILHIVRFKRKDLDTVIDDINSTGYGLTFGIHSRNETFYQQIAKKIDAGNIYINRNQIGAIVGVNPFGGHGLSGTGPKAGGPHYLMRFINEKTISNNITAIGGNASLLVLGGENE
ncbi:MAG: bifunctional proline dehydrogenase/L-glutamate gamma-semialdehyde dehydrogenase PutA [Gammaproteobacteria bacterium]|nr:bifunctional proline dehydrogenase/L-glutamate gamma-semialdehyde dehydrogenase PutA [Gammaproteobacteria bacterium]